MVYTNIFKPVLTYKHTTFEANFHPFSLNFRVLTQFYMLFLVIISVCRMNFNIQDINGDVNSKDRPVGKEHRRVKIRRLKNTMYK